MTVLDHARLYLRRGWSVLPVPLGEKKPKLPGWTGLRLTEDVLHQHFNGSSNIGLLLGEPSGGLTDVDLDCPEARELADQFLPPTPSVTGRQSAPRSHRWYISGVPATKQFRDPKTKEMIVELRSTGGQTLVGPSIHECGEVYDPLEGEPAHVPGPMLEACVKALHEAVVRKRYGETPNNNHAPTAQAPSSSVPVSGDLVERRAPAYLRSMPPAISGNGGHAATYAAATAMVHGFGLNPDLALDLLLTHYNPRCQPPWTEKELRHKVQDAATRSHDRPFGWLRDGVDKGEPKQGGTYKPSARRPNILIDTEEHRVIDETVEALRADPGIFNRGGVLVRVIRSRQPDDGVRRSRGSATIGILPPANLRKRVTRAATFTKMDRKGEEVSAHPPFWLVEAIDAQGEWPGIRNLMGVSDAPILRPDGSVWQTRGYDEVTDVLFESGGAEFPPVPDCPTLDDAKAGVVDLLEVACDFPFEAEEHRAAWLAGLLTPLAQSAFTGPSPLFLVDSNVRGVGKGLLAQTIGCIVLGREMPVSSYAHDREEMRKIVTSIAIAGDQLILLDNLEGAFGNAALDRALTTTRWKDRVLGVNKMIDLPLTPAWYATGNNVAVAADTARRVIHVRLDTLMELPEERTGFRHPNLLAWIRENRPRLLTAALTILSAYCKAGRPAQSLRPYGSFEGWSDLVRQAVVWVGMDDPCLTRIKLAETSDISMDALSQLLAAWKKYNPPGEGVVISKMLNRLYPVDRQNAPSDDAAVAMRAALENIVGCPAGKTPAAREVAYKLRGFRRRVLGGTYLDIDITGGRKEGRTWRLFGDATP